MTSAELKAVKEYIAWLEKDTEHLNEMAKSGYLHALKRVKEYVNDIPLGMSHEEASKVLTDWIDYVKDPESDPHITPYTNEEILLAMQMGAKALEKED